MGAGEEVWAAPACYGVAPGWMVGFEVAALTVVIPCILFPQECQTLLLTSTFRWPAAPRCR